MEVIMHQENMMLYSSHPTKSYDFAELLELLQVLNMEDSLSIKL